MGVSSFLRLQPGLKLLKPFSGAAHEKPAVRKTDGDTPIVADFRYFPDFISQSEFAFPAERFGKEFDPITLSRDYSVSFGFRFQPHLYKPADGFAPASLHTIETSTAEEQCQTALANALKTAFRNFKAGILSGNMVSSEAAVFAARYTFFSLYNVAPRIEPKTAVKNPLR